MQTITLDQKSISSALAGQFDIEAISSSLDLPISDSNTKCNQIGEHGFILSRAFQPNDALLTISMADDGPIVSLDVRARQESLGRILRCASMLITNRFRSIPVSWRPFHSDNRLSFQADRLVRSANGGKTNAGRVIVEFTHEVGPRVYAFGIDRSGAQDLTLLHPNYEAFKSALAGVSSTLAGPDAKAAPGTIENSVSLTQDLPRRAATHASSSDWYSARLTAAQRKFVDQPMTNSVRLVGPAGSGKTVALVVKCLRELGSHVAEKKKRMLFLTHASSTASGIENLVLGMEPERGLEILASDRPELVITTLYALANTQMRYELDQLTPVSLDGHEGRVFQADVLNDVIEQYKAGDWITFKSSCSAPFVAYIEADKDSTERKFFLWELLNEFACVLDAEGVRSGSARREQYLGEKRKIWMMVLQTKEEREVILNLYDHFRAWLRSEKAIGGDQMVADFLTHLDSFRWEATRENEGFDAVFVDELHLFNRQERMVFRHLLKSPDKPPAVFLAYDAKQSPRDTFLALPTGGAEQYDFWRDARLGKMEKIELVDVFRYTPQIAKALTCIDQSFPGQDLDEEWPAYSGIAKTDDGPLPLVCELASTIQTYTVVFQRAKNLQRKLGKDRKLAVLCASNELFAQYLKFSDYADSYHAIASRDEAVAIPQSARKFVFSMPEYVAGLQFDTVLLIEVNRNEVPDGPYAAAATRKFVSQLYLGASRAERQLELYASKTHGGISPVISGAVLEGAIKNIAEQSLS